MNSWNAGPGEMSYDDDREPAPRCGGTGMVSYWDGSSLLGEFCPGCEDCEPREPSARDKQHDAIHGDTVARFLRAV